jgi:hypothetical protein
MHTHMYTYNSALEYRLHLVSHFETIQYDRTPVSGTETDFTKMELN